MEELIDAVGSFGRFQWMLILFITFDLVCEKEWIKPVVTAVQMGGVLVGALYNHTGRKRIL
ncbi:uncharacterized protein LOC126811972 [Patella vulgata]|uniref:uncharacterized protein LOC126811972 n=1 Tax=Patella vulgata TaxID=6465 RepID=UPI0024A8681B|nr:uncharacterized protein LOC126811972 [Patella vulgata]